MHMVALPTAARSSDLSPKQLRRGGKVPAIVYGNLENTQIQCDENVLMKAYVQAGESTLVELDIGGKKVPALFHTVEFDPVSDRLSHVDFLAVDMKKELEAPVSIRFEDEAPAVKDFNATIVTVLDTVTVRCLPSNLPHDLPLSLASLAEVGASLKVSDLKVPEGVTILEDAESVLVVAQEQRAEEVEAPKPAEGEVAPAAEGAEGAAPAEGDAKKED
jgi:large subunit ribosomal protein L25